MKGGNNIDNPFDKIVFIQQNFTIQYKVCKYGYYIKHIRKFERNI